MKKYNIDKEYKYISKITAPINRIILTIGNFFLSIFPRGMKSNKKLLIKKEKINSSDSKKINFYIIKPKNHNNTYGIFYHGGGLVYKGAPHHYKMAKNFALENNMVIIFVDYRLSYNSKYLTSVNDSFSVYEWVINNKDFHIDNLFLIGDSAGGFLSLKTSLLAKQNNLTIPSLLLIYPVVDCSMRSDAINKYNDTPIWNSKLNKKMWKYYLKNNQEVSLLDEDLTYLKNVYIETAEFDCLIGESLLLYQKLKEYGINVILNETKNTMHGFDIKQNAKLTKLAFIKRNEYINSFNKSE